MVDAAHESLLKYETAILVSSSFTSSKSTTGGKVLPPLDKSASTRTEDYLNRILPPQEIVQDK
jgi:dynein light intermediate chain, axonemal